MSSLQRTKTNSFELTQSRTNILVQAFSRALIGLAAGLLVITASKGNVAFGFIENSYHSAALVAFGAGFGERFIPDIIAQVMSRAE